MDTRYSTIVVGCGGLGSAALYWLSRELGPEVLGLERFELARPATTARAFEKTFHA